jgi:hypothetical protein
MGPWQLAPISTPAVHALPWSCTIRALAQSCPHCPDLQLSFVAQPVRKTGPGTPYHCVMEGRDSIMMENVALRYKSPFRENRAKKKG